MTAILSQRQDDSPGSEYEGQIREFVRRDVLQRSRHDAVDATVTSVNSLIDRVAGASVQEIERVIRELESIRDRLRSEGDRVQREISRYATLSQSAMASLRVINDSLVDIQPSAESRAD